MSEKNGVLDLHIQGMSCTACAVRIEKAVGKMSGISSISVQYAAKSAHIRFTPDVANASGIIERIGQIGFHADYAEAAKGSDNEIEKLQMRFIVAALLTFPLLWAMAHHYSWLRGIPVPFMLQEPLLQFILAAIVQFFIGMPFYFGAFYALRERMANMDVLVAIGTTAAFGYSYYAMMTGGALYFETSAVVITAVLLGKLLEASATERVMRDNEAFAALQAKDALVLRSGRREKIPVDRIRVGDQLLAEDNQLLAADGIVLEGQASVDESFLTGESMPVTKHIGDQVFAGTRIRGFSALRIQVTAIGEDRLLSRITVLTRQAQSTKSSIGRKVDRISGIFVPVMLLLSLGTLLLWLLVLRPGDWGTASVHALAVLLAACPCALGLAAPISLVLASGKLARRGIVLKDAGALERLTQIDTIVLDKTGTLTEGHPSLTGISSGYGSPNRLLRLVAAVEEHAQHPFASAVCAAAKRAGLVVPEAKAFQTYLGKGVEATVEGMRIEVGNARFGSERGWWQPTPEVNRFVTNKEMAGETVVYVAINGEFSGALAFADPVKRSSVEAVQALQSEGIAVWMATGDHWAAANSAGLKTGIGSIHASMLPEQKVNFIKKLQQEGHIVGMVGDGFNDAPALAMADVGVAMGNGTEAALDAGHLTLIRPRLTGIHEALIISRLTVTNIRQNLGFAFVYNLVVIPFAALGAIEPWMAGTAMALSSVSVVGNALRLSGQMNRALNRSQLV
ncbi:copper-translocating P-type ATPase [Paenibacillus baekrokdamisoli]|uniref:P-type Cu(+) transporter n=1 Tax=Paenibacillus baekrokdamisoli TaxID=1712516 RepID=A0A3G9JAD2_9BACL|nr:heavy metal translocating P-type ATPase [Paenibacillus baekrokdamisoli]MBB3070608.1 Cu+-exporting ATPase [Paenibacillus baekrokdamisoli]BBH19959.1 copper-translocating P-type ATPase [Paenibacillus baekrokdamisoli]